MPRFGKITSSHEHTIYIVEAQWVGSKKWGQYSHMAFTDSRNPGKTNKWKDKSHLFVVMNADVCDKRRKSDTGPGFIESRLVFDHPADALACAERLRTFGRLSCGWEGPEDWREKNRVPLPGVRVVEERTAKIVREILPC